MMATDTHSQTTHVRTEDDFTRALTGAPHRTIDVGHARVASWSFGAGPDVLFVHGWPLAAPTFRRVAPWLAEGFRLHFFDLPGAGRTATPDLARVNLRDHIAATRAVIDALGLTRFALVAHDSGGAIARVAVADDPRVFAMVLGNTELPGHVPWQVKVFVAMARLGASGLLTRGMRLRAVRRSALGFGGCFRDPDYAEGAFGRLFVDPLMAPASARGSLALARNLDARHLGDLRAVHGAIRCPVQLIWGTDDPFFPVAGARAMRGEFAGGAELVELAGAKLFAHEDEPAAFGQAARAFLTTAAQRAGLERAHA